MKKNRKNKTAPPPGLPPEEKPPVKEQPKKQPFLKRLLFGEETPDLSELEAGSTTILDILSPTSVDTKSRDYIVVDGIFHAYLYITGYGYSTTVGASWLAPLVEAGEGVSMRKHPDSIFSTVFQPVQQLADTTGVVRVVVRYHNIDSLDCTMLFQKGLDFLRVSRVPTIVHDQRCFVVEQNAVAEACVHIMVIMTECFEFHLASS